MASQYANYVGVDNIMKAIQNLWPDEPYYSVWVGRDLMFQWNNGDIGKGRDTLEEMLIAAEQQGNGQLLTIKIHPTLKHGYITNKTEVIGSMHVRAYEASTDNAAVSGAYRGSPGDLSPGAYHLMKSVNDTLGAITTRLTELETAKAIEPKEVTVFDQIGSLLDKPATGELLAPVIGAIMQKFFPGTPIPNLRVSGVNDQAAPPAPPAEQPAAPGTDEVVELNLSDDEFDIIDIALVRLGKHCNVVEIMPLLADWADSNTAMFNTVIGQLKAKP